MTNTCPHCGLIHQTTCQRIKAMEYHSDGSVKRIEFHEPRPIDPKLSSVITLETLTANAIRRMNDPKTEWLTREEVFGDEAPL